MGTFTLSLRILKADALQSEGVRKTAFLSLDRE